MNKAPEGYIQKNRDSWNKRTEYHVKSAFYNMDAFLRGENSLREIELKLLGDVRGKSILHLQCHFGQDTLSLARMGAIVTGVDLSNAAITEAQQLQKNLGLHARFICCDVYDLPEFLDGSFDLVFISYGAIGWLPDLNKWGELISGYLKPGGRLVFVEFHPFIWMFDKGFSRIQYPYFNTGAIEETCQGTYADPQAEFTHENVSWNHSFEEVLTALIQNGLVIADFQEYDYSPYNCLPNLRETEPGRYRISGLERMVPMIYSIVATRGR